MACTLFLTKKFQRGFTMIELLVAATIIAVLSTIGIVSYTSLNQRARDGKRKADLEQVRSALELYRTDNGEYPEQANYNLMVGELVSTDYLGDPAPVDPKNDEEHEYTYSRSSATAYELCATRIEVDDASYCVENP